MVRSREMENAPATGSIQLLMRLARVVYRRSTEELLGIRLKELGALAYLRDNAEASQQSLTQALHLDANSCVLVLNDLEAAGFAERRRDANDRRVISWRSRPRAGGRSRRPRPRRRASRTRCLDRWGRTSAPSCASCWPGARGARRSACRERRRQVDLLDVVAQHARREQLRGELADRAPDHAEPGVREAVAALVEARGELVLDQVEDRRRLARVARRRDRCRPPRPTGSPSRRPGRSTRPTSRRGSRG